jgi:hypothetical protein
MRSRNACHAPACGVLFLCCTFLGLFPARGQSPLIGKPPSFERDVSAILTTHCLKCHGATTRKSGLDLRTLSAMLTGGTDGPAVVKGHAEKSLLFEQVSKGVMPPGKAPKLTEGQIATIRNWINAGAPTEQPEKVLGQTISDKDRQFWSFRRPIRPSVPSVKHVDRMRTPIDAFVLAKLEAKGLTLSPDADRLTLVRRVYLDLLGLPPSAEDLEDFLADSRPDAYERLVDRLLSSPHYGERWGRHWLDAAGYADTVGGDNDPDQVFLRDSMWRYRDYVVRALNEDKPFDRFLAEQLAGDEMDDWQSTPRATPEMREHLIATGFLRTSVDHTTEMELNRPFERYQVLHDTIENLTSNLLGLTVACARCHDHKFDPIPQLEYYRLMACLKPVYNPEAWIQPQFHHHEDVTAPEKEQIDQHNAHLDRQVAELNRQIEGIRQPVKQRLFAANLARLPEVLRADVRTALATEEGKRSVVQKYLADKLGPVVNVSADAVTKTLTSEQKAQMQALAEQIVALQGQRQSYGKIQAAWEPGGAVAPPTYLLRRGNHLTPGPEVQPGYFAVLTDPKRDTLIPLPPPASKNTGRRTAWARWLTQPNHPLTARVFVNRVWQHHFGEGIVTTPDNFGHFGARPSHPELLDWLAVEFIRSGWRMKALHRLIVTSSVYRQASSRSNAPPPGQANPEAVDPGNQLLWRMRLRRVESEVVRDAVLVASGKLDPTMGGAPVPIEPQADGRVVIPDKGLATPTAKWRRSLYLLARRNYNVSLLNVFDQPVMATNCTRRISSAVPLQSLTLMNDAFMLEQADYFAARVAAAAGSDLGQRIQKAFWIAFARLPTAKELALSRALVEKVCQRYLEQKLPADQAGFKALAKLCHMLLCTNEFLYVS